MATIIPPPSKRQKLAAVEKAERVAEESQIPEDLGSVRVQFVDQSTGKTTGPAVAVPVKDATVKNLETLLNTIQGNDPSERLPYRFFFRNDRRTVKDEDSSILDVQDDIYNSILKPGFKTTEDHIVLQFTPQAVFRVRAVSRCSASIAGHGEAILATAFSPETSSRMASGSGDNTARIWDCDTGTPLHTLKGHTSWVLAVSWSPDGKILATGSMDNTIRLWDPKTGEALGGPLKGHTKWITSLSWEPYHTQAPGKPRLASASKDGTVRIWDIPLRRIEQTLSGHKGSVTCVRWGGLHRIFTSSQDKTIKLWNDRSWNCLHTLSAHTHWVNHLALSTDFALRTSYHDHTGKPPIDASERKAQGQIPIRNSSTPMTVNWSRETNLRGATIIPYSYGTPPPSTTTVTPPPNPSPVYSVIKNKSSTSPSPLTESTSRPRVSTTPSNYGKPQLGHSSPRSVATWVLCICVRGRLIPDYWPVVARIQRSRCGMSRQGS